MGNLSLMILESIDLAQGCFAPVAVYMVAVLNVVVCKVVGWDMVSRLDIAEVGIAVDTFELVDMAGFDEYKLVIESRVDM